MNYANEYNKNRIVQEFKKDVLDHYNDHHTYFITYTFKNSYTNAIKLSPMNSLINFKRKLNNAAFNRASKRFNRIRLLCIREMSQLCKVSNMRKEDHYHCFLMIPKNCQERFFRRAVESVETAYYDKLDKDVLKLKLYPKIYKNDLHYKNDPNDVYQTLNPKPVLENYDLDVRFLNEIDDVSRAYDYATKAVCAHKVTYDLEDIKAFKSSQKRKTYMTRDQDDDHFLLF